MHVCLILYVCLYVYIYVYVFTYRCLFTYFGGQRPLVKNNTFSLSNFNFGKLSYTGSQPTYSAGKASFQDVFNLIKNRSLI